MALTLTIAGQEVLVSKGRITLPLTGCWHADLWADLQTIPRGDATATLSGVDMPSHIQRAEIVQGLVEMRLVGGRGGMAKMATPRHYKQPLVRHVFQDLMHDAGEAISTNCTAAVANTTLAYWTNLAVPIGSLVQALAEVAGAAVNWRVLFDGTVWLGTETWPMCPANVRVMEQDAANASQYIGTDAEGVWPGTSIAGRRIDSVVHEIGEKARSRVFWAEGTS
ncbi:MAG TPA: hypothetical protein VJ801_05955 [Polyangia bacterium]|jgi:hypothetical protein|nr:hypothetical protein [Polyangia bacterium]